MEILLYTELKQSISTLYFYTTLLFYIATIHLIRAVQYCTHYITPHYITLLLCAALLY